MGSIAKYNQVFNFYLENLAEQVYNGYLAGSKGKLLKIPDSLEGKCDDYQKCELYPRTNSSYGC